MTARGATPRPVLLVVGSTPPPTHGQAIMTQRVVDGPLASFEVSHVRTEFSSTNETVGRPSLGKAGHLARVLWRARRAIRRQRPAAVLYTPTGQSRTGLLRDLLLLPMVRRWSDCLVLWFQAGGVSELRPGLARPLRWWFDAAYAGAAGAIRPSEWTVDDPAALGAHRVVIVPNCADVPVATLPRARTDGPVRIVSVGTVCEGKGILVLLEALRIVLDQGQDVRSTIAGAWQPAAFEAEVRALVERRGLAEHVDFAGEVDREGVDALLEEADIFCFPTHYPSEAAPLVIAEAMAHGLPVVATRWRGIPTMVEHERTGLLVDTHDPVGLAAALRRLCDDPELATRLGTAGRAAFEDRFTTAAFLVNMDEALRRIVIER